MNTEQIALLRKTLEHITAHPEEWKQANYAEKTTCGTAYCVAGHVVVSQGHEFIWDDHRDYAVCIEDGRGAHFVAAEYLGLSSSQADRLFDGSNTLPELWGLANTMSQNAIEVPPEFL